VLLEFGADPNELDWEGTSRLKDALDAALRRLHWHMGKRERELQKFADICSRLVNFPTESRLARPVKKKKISSIPGHLVSLILHISVKKNKTSSSSSSSLSSSSSSSAFSLFSFFSSLPAA
jgi:hypothetical protein